MLSKILVMSMLVFPLSITVGQYRVNLMTSGNGGNTISGTNLKMYSTLGQILIGKSEEEDFKIQVGFWKAYQILTPVEEFNNGIPKKYLLGQNYPNPFNPTTTIRYAISNVETQDFASLQNVTLKIYDVLGREVATLVDKKQTPGKYSVQFNASNLPSGVYFYTLRAGNFVQTKKMLLLK